MRGVSESMAGRAAVLQLLPFSITETKKVSLLAGSFLDAVANPKTRGLWFSSYVQTYLERDVRSVTNIRDLITFRRFLALVAARHGSLINKTDLAAPLGVSVPTITEWLGILELTGQVILVPTYFENFGQRLVKTPKLYIGDSGLACHLLGIESVGQLRKSPFYGALFEVFVAGEICKLQANSGRRRELYHFRDQQGLEVDFLIPAKEGTLWLVECKVSKTVVPAMAGPIQSLRRSISGAEAKGAVVHQRAAGAPARTNLAPDVKALDMEGLIEALS